VSQPPVQASYVSRLQAGLRRWCSRSSVLCSGRAPALRDLAVTGSGDTRRPASQDPL